MLVYFTCPDAPVPPGVAAVLREAPAEGVSVRLESALRALLEGPTRDEAAAGFTSWFSSQTAQSLNSVAVSDDGRAAVNFADFSALIPNASTSNGSRMLLAELNTTTFQFAEIASVEYRFDGSCDAFWTWLQAGSCQVAARPY